MNSYLSPCVIIAKKPVNTALLAEIDRYFKELIKHHKIVSCHWHTHFSPRIPASNPIAASMYSSLQQISAMLHCVQREINELRKGGSHE